MDLLRTAPYVSGPYLVHYLSNGTDDVYMFGEDHRNVNQCRGVRAADAVELVKACADEGAHVYVEMITCFKSSIPLEKLVCERSNGHARKGVLNHLRTCLYIMKQKRPWLSIHFVDPRECFGARSFSKEEDSFIETMIAAPDTAQMQQRFVVPLLRSDLELFPTLAPIAQSMWQTRVLNRRSQLQCAIKRQSVQAAADLYRQAFDDVLNLCALSELERNISARHADSSAADKTHVMYFGSAHVLVLSQLLQSIGYELVYARQQRPDESCVRMRP
jgi:hypothetical protein